MLEVLAYGTKKKSMSYEKAEILIDSLLELSSIELGIFISLLSNRYISEYEITKEEFMQSLSNSLDKLNSKE